MLDVVLVSEEVSFHPAEPEASTNHCRFMEGIEEVD